MLRSKHAASIADNAPAVFRLTPQNLGITECH
jgi:hypothetical protein